MTTRRFLLLVLLALVPHLSAKPVAYDPLQVPDREIVSKPFAVDDTARNRRIPLRIYLPATEKPAPVILFSHGLGGSRDNNPYLGNHWAKRGYAVVFIQHPGSDEDVWKNIPPARRIAAMRDAASHANLIARARDVSRVIDALAAWNGSSGHPLAGRLDLQHLGMSGHSFGALTTQILAGQTAPGARVSLADPRIAAAVMMSPSIPAAADPAAAFAAIQIPCLLMTGTRDSSPIRRTTPADRLQVFPALRNAAAWQVVFENLEHKDFGGRSAPSGNRYHPPILALTTAFWDAHLKDNPRALHWLAHPALTPQDHWQANPKAKQATASVPTDAE